MLLIVRKNESSSTVASNFTCRLNAFFGHGGASGSQCVPSIDTAQEAAGGELLFMLLWVVGRVRGNELVEH